MTEQEQTNRAQYRTIWAPPLPADTLRQVIDSLQTELDMPLAVQNVVSLRLEIAAALGRLDAALANLDSEVTAKAT